MGFGHAHGDMTRQEFVTKAQRRQVFLKTTSYGLMHMVVAIGVAYALSGDWRIALAIGLIEPCVQTVAYFFHERAWHKFGSKRQAHTHNAITDSTNPLPKIAHPKDGR